jgi:hypothetical protein
MLAVYIFLDMVVIDNVEIILASRASEVTTTSAWGSFSIESTTRLLENECQLVFQQVSWHFMLAN